MLRAYMLRLLLRSYIHPLPFYQTIYAKLKSTQILIFQNTLLHMFPVRELNTV